MAFISVQVAGPVIAPTGLPPHAAKIEFRLRTRVTAGDTLAVPQLVTENVVGGEIDVTLIGSTDGVVYDVTYIALLGASVTRVNIGPIVLDGPGPYALAELLPIQIPANATDRITIKQGDTLNIGAIWLDEYSRPCSLVDVTVAASLRSPSGDLTETQVTLDSDLSSGRYGIGLTAEQTAEMATGAYAIDVRYSRNGQVAHSSDGTIIIARRVTE